MTGILKLMTEYNLTEEEVREKFNLYHQPEIYDLCEICQGDYDLCEICQGHYDCCCICATLMTQDNKT